MRPRKIFLLILLLLAGASIETTWRLRNHMDFGPLGWRVFGGRFYGPSFSFDESRTETLAAATGVSVDNSFGGVRITQGEPGQVHVALRKVVFLPTEPAARDLAARVEIRTRVEGSDLAIATNREDLERSGALANAGLETHLDITVPPGTAVQVRNEHGRVDVSDAASADVDGSFEPINVERVTGDADVKAQHGDVMVSSIGGAVRLSTRHGDVHLRDIGERTTGDVEHGKVRAERTGALTLGIKHGDLEADTVGGAIEFRGEHSGARVSGVSGPADVETTFDDVRLERVTGGARVRTEHGAVVASDVAGTMSVEASFGDVQLSAIGGNAEVVVEHGGVHARALHGGATLRTSGDDVSLKGFRGAVRIEIKNGGVHLAPGEPLTAPLSVNAEHGGIDLRMPPASAFDLDATAQPGDVKVDVEGFSTSEVSGSRVTGRAGQGGTAVTLTAHHGDVTVESGETATPDE
jgi:DUF4097 and DUF4098 domain-containing protein YvlB